MVSQFKVNRSLLFLNSKQVLTWVIKSPSSSTTTLMGILSEACSHETFSQWNCKRFSCTNSQNCTAGSSFEAMIQDLSNPNLWINFKSVFKSKVQSKKINCRKNFKVKFKNKQFNQDTKKNSKSRSQLTNGKVKLYLRIYFTEKKYISNQVQN